MDYFNSQCSLIPHNLLCRNQCQSPNRMETKKCTFGGGLQNLGSLWHWGISKVLELNKITNKQLNRLNTFLSIVEFSFEHLR